MNNETMQLLEKLGVKFDLTLEPGQLPRPAVFPDKPFSGSLPDLRGIPVRPYRPQTDLFTRSDPSGAGIWTIPLSAGPLNSGAGEGQAEYQTLNFGCEPVTFFHIARYILTRFDRPYLTLVMRSDVGVHPRLLRNMQINLSNIINHPMAPRFVFCTPPEAMKVLQMESDGA